MVVATGPAPAGDLEPSGWDGLDMAAYLPAVFPDSDGDLRPGGDDTYVAIGTTLPLYLEGEVPVELAAQGLVEGWNAVTLDIDTGDFVAVVSPSAIPVAFNLEGDTTLTVGGTSTATDARFALVSLPLLDGTWVAPLVDTTLGDTWSVDLADEPPSDHFSDIGSASAAIEFPAAYTDADGSESVSENDALAGGPCIGGVTVAAAWFAGPTDLESAIAMVRMEVATGWQLIGEDDTTTYGFSVRDPADASSIVLDPACTLE